MSKPKFAELVKHCEIVYVGYSDLHICANKPVAVRHFNDLIKLNDTVFNDQDIINFLKETGQPPHDLDNDFAVEAGDFRWRINAASSLSGMALVARKIPKDIPHISSLGVPKFLGKVIAKSSGLFLVTGITGSGKSTTLAAMIDLINKNRPVKIVTLENPIEFVYKAEKADIVQREIKVNTESFSTGIRAAMREDPDVILVGEIRDAETAEAALELAETGHLVFATLHSDKAKDSVDRLVSLFAGTSNTKMRLSSLSSALIGTLSQKLVNKMGGGRVMASELMINTPGVAALIRDGDSAKIQNIVETSSNDGMYTLNASLEGLVNKGLITPDTAREFSYDLDNLHV